MTQSIVALRRMAGNIMKLIVILLYVIFNECGLMSVILLHVILNECCLLFCFDVALLIVILLNVILK